MSQRRLQKQKLETIKDTRKRQKTENEVSDLNKAIDHWRKVFAACVDQDEKHKTKPFEGWNVVIYSTESRGAPFKRIIQAGGGFVMRIRIGLKIISLNINI